MRKCINKQTFHLTCAKRVSKTQLREVQVKVMSFYYLNTRNFETGKFILDSNR